MKWENQNILITGITGFVGSYLAKELLKKKSNVYGLVRGRSDGTKAKNLVDKNIHNDVKLLEGDLTDITSLAGALDKSDPDVIFHLAGQSFVPRSFKNPIETQQINSLGTLNLLEAVRIKDYKSKIIFAGSSEEYGLVISSENQYKKILGGYGTVFPEPEIIPELPIKENNPLRPMSPYAVSKVYGDYLMRNYYHSYQLDTVVSRAFNHEGAGRGLMFVTSSITNQVMQYKLNEVDHLTIGNVNAFRDWSHVKDIIKGYILLSEKGKSGEVYNQGSNRTNSVLSYVLLSLEQLGFHINKIETFKGEKNVENPTNIEESKNFGFKLKKTLIDHMILNNRLEYNIKDQGIMIYTDNKKIPLIFNPNLYRPAEVPILLSDTSKIKKIGAKINYELKDIIRDQLNYFLEKNNRIKNLE